MATSELDRKADSLLSLLSGWGSVAVAFSGGVDSAVVAKAAHLALGENAIAFTAVSPSLATGELENARAVAEAIGIRHEVIHTHELERSGYVANAPNRCYFCKTELYEHLGEIRSRLDFDVIANGANLDDRGDHRPGMKAAAEHGVRSPLIEAGLTKADVRALARKWGLSVWDKPASPCLASRLAYGVKVTPERLKRVDAAESMLRETLEQSVLRVRHESNDLARIEIPLDALPRLLEPGVREKVVAELHRLGFRYVTVDLEGFRSGSLNSVVPLASLARFASSRD